MGAEAALVVRIGSNISSLQAQRRLSEASSTLSKTYERLSSGQRINRASDDAAGLSIAASLGAGRRVFTQGVRNLNDGISALQIADSAVGNLSQIVTRIRELAEQAANGTFSSAQREAIDKEAQALQKEYFRVSRSASFNGTNLFDGSLPTGIRLQGGFGSDGSIQSSLGGVMGDGTFSPVTTVNTSWSPTCVALGDLDQDGVLDMVSANYQGNTVGVMKGNGDGTFSEEVMTAGNSPFFVTLGDLNSDGVLDLLTADGDSATVSVLIGKGDGTFSPKTSYATGSRCFSVALGDVNGDGVPDMVSAEGSNDAASVFIGKGDGTFFSKSSFAVGDDPMSVALGDFNSDGVLDLITADNAGDTASVLIGKGDGTFSPKTSFATGDRPRSIALGDLNGDGLLDIVTADYGDETASVLIGKGDGSFFPKTTYSIGEYPSSVGLGDVNGDGVLDLVSADDAASVLIGGGDGTFSPRTSYSANLGVTYVTMGDLNGDGVLDMVSAATESSGVLLGHTREGAAPLLPFSLTTQSGALQAMAPLDRKIDQLSAQRGVIGAFQSRLSVAINTLQSTTENYAAAESRIRDADIALEAAELVRLQISRQAATAVLAQANQQPALAVRLLQ